MAKRVRNRKPKAEVEVGSPVIEQAIEETTGKVAMRFPLESMTKKAKSIAVADCAYVRRADGTFLCDRKHLQALREAGLVRA